MKAQAGDRLAVMVNGLGATPPEDLYILYRSTLSNSEGVTDRIDQSTQNGVRE
jgi:dihydroxyacetone kinase